MAIAFDAIAVLAGDGAGHATGTITVAAGGILLVFVDDFGGTQTTTGVTFDGVAMTQLQASTDNSGGVDASLSAWVLHNPTTGSAKTVTATFSGVELTLSVKGHAISYTGVANGSAAATHRTIFSGGDGGGAGADLTITDSQSGDVCVGSVCNFDLGNNATLSANQTNRRTDNNIDTSGYDLSTQDASASGANTVLSWTNDEFTTCIGFALIPSGGGGETITMDKWNHKQADIARRKYGVVASGTTGIKARSVRRDRIVVPDWVEAA